MGVKSDADFENNTSKRISQSLRVVLVDFNENGVVFQKIFVLSASVMLGIILGVKQYADYENIIAECISRG